LLCDYLVSRPIVLLCIQRDTCVTTASCHGDIVWHSLIVFSMCCYEC